MAKEQNVNAVNIDDVKILMQNKLWVGKKDKCTNFPIFLHDLSKEAQQKEH